MKEKSKKGEGVAQKLMLPFGIAMIAFAYAVIVICISICYVNGHLADGTGIFGSILLLLAVFAAYTVYLAVDRKEILRQPKLMLLACICILTCSVASILTSRVDVCFSPMLLAVLIIALLVDKRAAYATALLCAVIYGVCVAANEGVCMHSFAAAAFNAVCGAATVLALHLRGTRSTPVLASALGGAAGAAAFIGAMMMDNELFLEYWRHLIWLIGCALLCGVLTVGLMPLLETLFDIATDARLNELLNNNNPLLKRLMLEAPGTYHHSMIVASLAEAAAETVGADPLLCKVSAYYHDVGKLRSPQCFKENQRPDYNIHDELDPYESAQRIIAHQHDGVVLLSKHRIPSAVTKIVSEHHGDSVMVYFYDKALKAAKEGETVDENRFRYPSQKPSTKESAIILLADCCEAAVRSMPNPTAEEIAAKVQDVITHKWDKRGGMLWASPLTFNEITKIEQSFIRTFSALHHERIEYPDLDEVDVR